METFSYLEQDDYEQLIFCQDKASGLKAIIAIHDTTLGPALGGTRMWNYQTEQEAIEDALRLAKGMTYKNAAAGLNVGGGKTVIIGDPKNDKSPEMFRALGRYIQGLNGRYITAEDVGTTVLDMDYIHMETDYVAGTSSSSGNPSPVTAYGLYLGMKATAKEAFGTDDLRGKKVAVQGVGNVAYKLCDYLHQEGAELIVTDINETAIKRVVQEFNARAVATDEIYQVECDIFSPCALGAVLNDDTIKLLKAKAIAGSANNQLASNKHGDLLHEKGILYAPDFVINAGGVINVEDELHGYNEARAMKKVETIYTSLETIFEISRNENIPTYIAADQMAINRLASVSKLKKQFLQNPKSILTNR